MEQKPPRRARRRSGGEPSFPIVPAVLAVLVVGFLIGTALSLLGNRARSPVAFRSSAPLRSTAKPSAAQAPPPLNPVAVTPVVTPSPRRTAKPAPTVKPSLPPTPVPTLSPAPTAAPAATPRARPGAAATSPAVAARSVTAEPARDAAKPSGRAGFTPTTAPLPAAPGATGDYGDSDFAQLAAGVVRSYLGALTRGDQDSAYAAFGANPGDRGIIFTEQGILDAKTQIVRVDARQTGTDAATVDVVLNTSKGQYFAQYFLKRSPTGAALITDHEMIKP